MQDDLNFKTGDGVVLKPTCYEKNHGVTEKLNGIYNLKNIFIYIVA